MLSSHDDTIIQVVLEGIDNILRAGESHKIRTQEPEFSTNHYSIIFHECGGLEKVEDLQQEYMGKNEDICVKAYQIVQRFFETDVNQNACETLKPETLKQGLHETFKGESFYLR
eukprot:gnl/MRDRNA2_/MRDRNA2_86710_c1_seq3.p2 gnl/MRDRNA2_/MRDRNA2_86710_c1~~gnl/MRDRNA2_/MRDRNA2_86710_c1_seq3.p2  ORF type:complete len:114 (+),score=12.33 gnl/MRDRNA2_/MRDRNA2_86710_c1_seq3:472-813(+)